METAVVEWQQLCRGTLVVGRAVVGVEVGPRAFGAGVKAEQAEVRRVERPNMGGTKERLRHSIGCHALPRLVLRRADVQHVRCWRRPRLLRSVSTNGTKRIRFYSRETFKWIAKWARRVSLSVLPFPSFSSCTCPNLVLTFKCRLCATCIGNGLNPTWCGTGVPPQVRNNRWKDDDRDTNQGRCKYNRDCRLGDGPDHTGSLNPKHHIPGPNSSIVAAV